MKNIIKLYTLTTTLLLGLSAFTAATATTFKCVVGGRIVYSNVASTCDQADQKLTMTQVAVDKYPLDVGVRKGKMGDAARAYLSGQSLVIPHYGIDPRDDVYGEPTPLIVPDLSRAEYNGNGGYTGGREYDDYGAVRPRSNR